MYQVGELIIYGSYGVCKVEAVGAPNISGLGSGRIYYTLNPLYQGGRVYAPIDSNVFMRPIISYVETQQLISRIPSISEYDYNTNNIKFLEQNYKECIKTHDCVNLIKIIKTIYTKRLVKISQGKKPGQVDEKFLKRAEDLLYGEFAVTLGIPKENVRSYIEDKVKEISN